MRIVWPALGVVTLLLSSSACSGGEGLQQPSSANEAPVAGGNVTSFDAPTSSAICR